MIFPFYHILLYQEPLPYHLKKRKKKSFTAYFNDIALFQTMKWIKIESFE